MGGLYDGGKHPYHRYIGFRRDYKLAQEEAQVAWTTGAAISIPHGLWDALGGFDEAYQRGYFEDVDLCERAKLLGAEIWYVPAVVFTHYVGKSTGQDSGDMEEQFRRARMFQHNRWLFHKRWDAHIVPDVPVIFEPNL